MILKNESALVGTNCSVKFREIRINPRTQDRSLKSGSIQERSLTKLNQGERETHRASLTKLDQGECETHRASAQCSVYDVEVFNRAPTFTDQRLR